MKATGGLTHFIEGLLPAEGRTFNNRLNRLMASSIDAEVILVTTLGEESPEEFERKVETLAALYGGIDNPKLIGCIINRIGKPLEESKTGLVPIVDSSADEAGAEITSAEEAAAALQRALDAAPTAPRTLLLAGQRLAEQRLPRLRQLLAVALDPDRLQGAITQAAAGQRSAQASATASSSVSSRK